MKLFKVLLTSAILIPVYTYAAGLAAAATPESDQPKLITATLADRDGNRLSDDLEARLSGMDPQRTIAVIVTFSGTGSAAAAQRAVGPFAVSHEYNLINGFAATVTAAQARALAAMPGVFRVEEDGLVSAALDVSRPAFGVDAVQADPLAGGLGMTGTDVGICIVDTGIFPGHEQFVDGAGISKVVGFIDFVNGGAAAYDDNGHGSVVAGIAAGDGTGSTTTATTQRGVAPGAELYGAKVLDSAGDGALSDVAAAIEWCVAQPGVDIINLSLSTVGSSDGADVMSLAANAAVGAGKLVVIAAGNFGDSPATIGAPGAAALAVTVGAAAEWTTSPPGTWHSAGTYTTAFSGKGPTADGRIKPDILAPGLSIRSASVGLLQLPLNCTTCYSIASGTSMAAPFVSGTAALMMEASGGTRPSAAMRDILLATAQPRGGGAGKDNETGFGLLDAWAAVKQAQGVGVADYQANAFPSYAHGRGAVADSGVTRIPIESLDPSRPLAVTILIDGKAARLGWKPDLEARLLDANGNPLNISTAISTCPAGNECSGPGRQETLHISPPVAANYILEVWPYGGFPNNGNGGSFTYELSNGHSAGDITPPGPDLTANAGPDLSANDGDKDGVAAVELDGSASGPFGTIALWQWGWTDGAGITHSATGIAPIVALPVGEHSITLTVADIYGLSASDTVAVSVTARGGGGGGPSGAGSGKGNGS